MTDKYFDPYHEDDAPTTGPAGWEDEFSQALHAEPDVAVTESWALRARAVSAQVRRRRTVRAAGAIASCLVLALGIGAAAQIPNWITTPPHPAEPVPVPVPGLDPLRIDCETTLDQVIGAPGNVDGFTLEDFALDDSGAPSAILTGPESTRTKGQTLDLSDSPVKTYDPAGLGTLWFAVDDNEPTGNDVLSIDLDMTAQLGVFPSPSVHHADQTYAISERPLAGTGLLATAESPTPCPNVRTTSAESPEDPVSGPLNPLTGTYAIVGFTYLGDTDDAASFPESRNVLLSRELVMVWVKDGVVIEMSRSQRAGTIDMAPTDVDDRSTSPRVHDEPVARADVTPLAFEYHDWRIEDAERVPVPEDVLVKPKTGDQDIELISLADATTGLWLARFSMEHTDPVHPGDYLWGTWTKGDGFRSWDATHVISPSQERWTPTFTVDESQPGSAVWLESDGIQTAAGPFWIFAADARNDSGPRLIVGPDDTADNRLDSPQLAIYDGRVYWDEYAWQGPHEGSTVVRSASLTGDAAIRTEAVDATRPVTGPDGIWVITLKPGTSVPAGVAQLTGSGADPFLTLTNAGESWIDMRPSEQAIAVRVDDTIYVVSFQDDHPVWTISLEQHALMAFDYSNDGTLTWSQGGARIYTATPWRSERIAYYKPPK